MSDHQRENPQKGPQGGPRGGPMGPMTRPVEKARYFSISLKRLIRYLAPQKYRFILVGLLASASAVFSIVGPKIMGKATTRLGEGVLAMIRNQSAYFDLAYIGHIILFLAGLYSLSALCGYMTAYIMSGVSQNTVCVLREQVKEKLDRLPLTYFDTRTHGEILSRVTNDMDNIAVTLQQSLTQLITSLITLIGILIMMLSISPLLTLVTVITLPVSVALTLLIAKYSQRFFAEQQRCLGRLNGHVEEMFTGHKIIKAFGREKASCQTFDAINDELYISGWKAQFISGMIMPALSFVSNIGYVLICIAGGLMVAEKALEIGDIQAFIQYMRAFTQPILQTGNIINIFQSTIASAERVFEILDEAEETPEKDPPATIPSLKGAIAFDHVQFGYSEDALLIQDMNFQVKPGQMVAIVGPTGAGKTTLVNLMLRFYELKGGQIKIDGVSIAHMSRSGLRSLFGMVLQDTWLFNGAIGENIGYGKDAATPEMVTAAAKAARADRFIRALPEGYQTVLNEEASNISQGQKQLLTIARAILTDPPILILDEATSSVDTRTEILIQKAMNHLMKGRTSFVIAHRLSTIRNADLILVMNKGSLVEQGTHDALMAAQGFYADIYNSQFTDKSIRSTSGADGF